MNPKVLPVLEMCISNGLKLGYNRAFKHTEQPSEEAILLYQEQAIMSELFEWFDMGVDDADQ